MSLITKKEKNRIDSVCKEYHIENYSINPDGSIDVDGDVDLQGIKLVKLPVKFNNVSGSFHCGFNFLTSLEGCPHTVGRGFSCIFNALTTLEGSPDTVGGYFMCSTNKITSLIGAPNTVGGDFLCYANKLSSLVGSPVSVHGSFKCLDNKIITLEGAPHTIGRGLYCSNDYLISIYSGDTDIEINMEFECSRHILPQLIVDNFKHIKLILKFQRYFEIWDDKISLNVKNFNDLISEIEDGLE